MIVNFYAADALETTKMWCPERITHTSVTLRCSTTRHLHLICCWIRTMLLSEGSQWHPWSLKVWSHKLPALAKLAMVGYMMGTIMLLNYPEAEMMHGYYPRSYLPHVWRLWTIFLCTQVQEVSVLCVLVFKVCAAAGIFTCSCKLVRVGFSDSHALLAM